MEIDKYYVNKFLREDNTFKEMRKKSYISYDNYGVIHKPYYEQIEKITLAIKLEIIDSLKGLQSIINSFYHGYYDIPEPTMDGHLWVNFPKDYLGTYALMSCDAYYGPREYCDIRTIIFEGVDKKGNPIITLFGEPIYRYRVGNYTAGGYLDKEFREPETDLDSYLRINRALLRCFDADNEKWFNLFRVNNLTRRG